MSLPPRSLLFFFFNDTATTEIYTLSLHDALPISRSRRTLGPGRNRARALDSEGLKPGALSQGFQQASRKGDRKSTRLNSSHSQISYAVFCLKKKKNKSSSHGTTTKHRSHLLLN